MNTSGCDAGSHTSDQPHQPQNRQTKSNTIIYFVFERKELGICIRNLITIVLHSIVIYSTETVVEQSTDEGRYGGQDLLPEVLQEFAGIYRLGIA
jgi:hypothetical protein